MIGWNGRWYLSGTCRKWPPRSGVRKACLVVLGCACCEGGVETRNPISGTGDAPKRSAIAVHGMSQHVEPAEVFELECALCPWPSHYLLATEPFSLFPSVSPLDFCLRIVSVEWKNSTECKLRLVAERSSKWMNHAQVGPRQM